MREIKFRVWDTQLFIMLTEQKDKELGDAYEPLWNLKCIRGGKISYPLGVIMQYTGLKDTNGVEIYEGDIIKTNHALIPIGVIKYWGVYHSYEIESPDGENCIGNKYKWNDFEVIGNIYENPEMLLNI